MTRSKSEPGNRHSGPEADYPQMGIETYISDGPADTPISSGS
jgi:hypothetical protein